MSIIDVSQANVGNVGTEAYKRLAKPAETINVIDMQREMQKKLPKILDDIIANHKNYADEYYIVIEYQRFRLLPNVIRMYQWVRKTRPSPGYDLSLFSYNNKTNELKYYWTLPDMDTANTMVQNQEKIPKEEKQLLQFVLDYRAGKLE